ncbi:MAG: sugar kinase [Microbacterium sp.]|uniref:sugar kinase n=1 Tax=Microbacterium sp. TaxID=51671 RepID=UPI0039E5156C
MNADVVDLLAIGETMALITPAPGRSLAAEGAARIGFGGAESNVAAGVVAGGGRAAWLSAVGDDPFGELIVAGLRARGVDTAAVRVDPTRPTGLMLKQPGAAGSRVLYYRAGSAAAALSPADLGRLPPARVVHTSGITAALSSSCRELVAHVLDGAAGDAVVSFDVNHRPALWPSLEEAASTLLDLARRAHIVFVGRDEAERLWGTVTAEAAHELLPDVPHLVVKDGEVEAVEFGAAGVSRIPAHHVEVVEPVGAGDAFAAGWLSAWLSGLDAPARLQAGHDGAAAVLRSTDDLPPASAGGMSPMREAS